MADEIKSLKDNLLKALNGISASVRTAADDDELEDGGSDPAGGLDASAVRALLSAVFVRAGRSKDEVVQILGREIGQAIAAMLREPLSQLAKNQKLQISFELVPKSEGDTGNVSIRQSRTKAPRAKGPVRHEARRRAPRAEAGAKAAKAEGTKKGSSPSNKAGKSGL